MRACVRAAGGGGRANVRTRVRACVRAEFLILFRWCVRAERVVDTLLLVCVRWWGEDSHAIHGHPLEPRAQVHLSLSKHSYYGTVAYPRAGVPRYTQAVCQEGRYGGRRQVYGEGGLGCSKKKTYLHHNQQIPLCLYHNNQLRQFPTRARLCVLCVAAAHGMGPNSRCHALPSMVSASAAQPLRCAVLCRTL
jgi:hypothetical protein